MCPTTTSVASPSSSPSTRQPTASTATSHRLDQPQARLVWILYKLWCPVASIHSDIIDTTAPKRYLHTALANRLSPLRGSMAGVSLPLHASHVSLHCRFRPIPCRAPTRSETAMPMMPYTHSSPALQQLVDHPPCLHLTHQGPVRPSSRLWEALCHIVSLGVAGLVKAGPITSPDAIDRSFSHNLLVFCPAGARPVLRGSNKPMSRHSPWRTASLSPLLSSNSPLPLVLSCYPLPLSLPL